MGKHVKHQGINESTTTYADFEAKVKANLDSYNPRHSRGDREAMLSGIIKAPDERDGNLGEVIDRRVQVYGDPVIGFAEIAEMWTTYLGFPVQAHQVPMMMVLLKVVRSKTSPDYSDHSDDIEGYLDIFRKIIGPDMIQARSVTEYIAKKWPGES